MIIELHANRKSLKIEIDTGAALSIISEETRRKIFPDEPLRDSSIFLKTYTGERIRLMGQLNLSVGYEGQKQNLVMLVVEGNGPSLYGRNWIKYIHPNWHKIGTVHSSSRFHSILEKHEAVFKNDLGRIRSHTATLQVQPGATPNCFRARQVPFAIRDAVGSELDRLEREGILTSHS